MKLAHSWALAPRSWPAPQGIDWKACLLPHKKSLQAESEGEERMLHNTVLAQFFLLLLCSLLSPAGGKEIHVGVQRQSVQTQFVSIPMAGGYRFSLRSSSLGEATGDLIRGYTISYGSESSVIEVSKFIPDARFPFPKNMQKATWKCQDGTSIQISRHDATLVVEPSAFPGMVITVH